MKKLTLIVAAIGLASCASQQLHVIESPSESPLVTLRVTFLTGAASDPADKPGLANLTATMLSDGGSATKTYQEILDQMFPMATSVSSQVDKEMTTFSAVTHVDNLDAFYELFRDMLLDPGWREEDLTRLRDQTVNFLRVSLRGNNDEELGKEFLYSLIYEGHPYEPHNAGTVAGIESISLADMKAFHAANYTQANLIVGIAGGYSPEFLSRVKSDFAKLPAGQASTVERSEPQPIEGIHVRMIDKQTRSVAFSIGFPIDVKRGDADYLPLLVMQSYFGPHRDSGGHLFQRMRETRGLNYGDYAYIEYFPRGMFQLMPDANLGRPLQIFQIWIRPVDPATAHFALRLAMCELNKLIEEGIPEEDFERTRTYLTKYVNLLIKTKQAELGYAIDSHYYGIPEYAAYVKDGLARVTRDDVNAAIKRHLRTDNLYITVVTPNADDFKKQLEEAAPSPMTYNSPKPEEILAEDKIVQTWEIPISSVEITPVDQIFE